MSMPAKKHASPLAWVGSITAVFSLIAGIYGGWVFLSGQIERRRTVDHLLAVEAVQLRASDYESAWKTLAQAAAIDPGSSRVQHAREDVAMRWLDNMRISGEQTFASIVEKLEPVLTSGVAAAKPARRQADLLAHLGWSYFLRSRESPSGPDPEIAYRNALQKDPANPYAHTMWGHWMLWNHQGLEEASRHFAAALASSEPIPRQYIRSLQLSALRNAETTEASAEIIRVANEVRQEHAELEQRWPHDLLNIYWEYLVPPNDRTDAFLRAVPPADHLATFDWLLAREGAGERDSLIYVYMHNALAEAAGRTSEALAGYRSIESRLAPESRGALAELTHKALIRLAGAR